MGTTQSKDEIRRLALIFSHKTFQQLPARDGNESEVEHLNTTLRKYGLDVQVFQDQTKSNILNTMQHYACRDFSDYDCLLVIVLTHGDRGGVLWACDVEYNARDVWGPFLQCHTLRNKPKIFIFQACRGGREELVVPVSGETQPESKESHAISVPLLPHKPGFLLVHSTVEENVSKRDPKTGSIYIQSLCNRLQDKNLQNTDILTLLTNVNSDVLKFEQTATFTSFLHQPVTIGSPMDEHPSTSQSSSLRNDAKQGVVPQSIYPSNGEMVVIILYTSNLENKAKEMTSVLQRLPGCVILLNVNMDGRQDLETELNQVATNPKRTCNNAHSLLVMVLAELCETSVTEYSERIFFKTTNSLLPFNSIWKQFTAAQCQWLRAKPKLFFFCDLYRTDDAKGLTFKSVPTEEAINNTVDFFWAFCYGQELFRELLFAFERPEEEITQLMTTAMRKAESKMAEKIGRFSHFQSTLKFQFFFQQRIQEENAIVSPLFAGNKHNVLQPPNQNLTMQDRAQSSPALPQSGSALPRINQRQRRLPTSTLLKAVEQENITEVQRWLKVPKVDVNMVDKQGTTPLILACKNRNSQIVGLLLATGNVKVNLLDQDRNGALYWAARRGHLEICEMLIKNNAAVNVRNKYENTPIYWPAREGNLEVVKPLVMNGADIHNRGKLGRQPLHWAASNQRLEVVSYLVEHGADIDSTTKANVTVLYEAAGLGRLNSVKRFVELGATVDMKMLYAEMTALALAVQSGKFSVVKYLLEQGADVNTKDNHENTPLHHASQFPNIFYFLIENGADETQENIAGNLPFLLVRRDTWW